MKLFCAWVPGTCQVEASSLLVMIETGEVIALCQGALSLFPRIAEVGRRPLSEDGSRFKHNTSCAEEDRHDTLVEDLDINVRKGRCLMSQVGTYSNSHLLQRPQFHGSINVPAWDFDVRPIKGQKCGGGGGGVVFASYLLFA